MRRGARQSPRNTSEAEAKSNVPLQKLRQAMRRLNDFLPGRSDTFATNARLGFGYQI